MLMLPVAGIYAADVCLFTTGRRPWVSCWNRWIGNALLYLRKSGAQRGHRSHLNELAQGGKQVYRQLNQACEALGLAWRKLEMYQNGGLAVCSGKVWGISSIRRIWEVRVTWQLYRWPIFLPRAWPTWWILYFSFLINGLCRVLQPGHFICVLLERRSGEMLSCLWLQTGQCNDSGVSVLASSSWATLLWLFIMWWF